MDGSKKANGIFTALGAATGLGNALRFPSLCAIYGGGFVFAYAISLVLVCFPLLCGELYLGKRYALSYDKALRSFSPKLYWLAFSAAINSAVIALYYGVISAKLGGAFFSFSVSGTADDTRGVALLGVGALSVSATWLILRGGGKRMAKTGAVCTFGSLFLFAVLAVAVIVSGGIFRAVFSFELAELFCGGLWADALGQSLLALSLAGGVMPTFARSFGSNFSIAPTAAKIIGANFLGCLFGAVSALAPAVSVPESGGVTVALTLYPRVIFYAFGSGAARRIFGIAFFAVLWLVAVQSACSLFSPVIGLFGEEKRKTLTTVLCLLSLTLAPVFGACGSAAMHAVDRMACSVNAVIIAFFESLAFTSAENIAALKNDCGAFAAFLLKTVCPLSCGALALFSASGARFSAFPFYASACAFAAFACVFVPAAVCVVRRLNSAFKRNFSLKSHK